MFKQTRGPSPPLADFYWRRARLALIITRPRINLFLKDLPAMNDTFRNRMENLAPFPDGVRVLTIPYYVILKQPTAFLSKMRGELLKSNAYPRLAEKIRQ